jgi:hypothetical protein
MAKVYQLQVVGTTTQAQFDLFAHSLMFADSLNPVYFHADSTGGPDANSVVVTSGIEVAEITNILKVLADDSQSEVSIDISTGKFVEGNLIAVLCPTSEAQSDLRDFMTFYATSGDIHLHVGVCNTTQSQDYTPDIIANSRVIKMISPAQAQTLGL